MQGCPNCRVSGHTPCVSTRECLVTRKAWGMTPSNLAALAAWLYCDTASLEITYSNNIFFNLHQSKKTVTGMWGTGCSLVALDVNIEVRNVTCMALDARFPMVDTHSQVREQSDSVSISKPRLDTLWIGIARCEDIWNMHPSFTTSF